VTVPASTNSNDGLGGSVGACEIAREVRTGRLSAVDVATAALARAEACQPQVNAFTTVTAERALEAARAVDRVVDQGGDPGPLAGVPFAVKDLFDLAGVPTRAGSMVLAERDAPRRDAEVIRRLGAAGAVVIGALNMDEFAFGFTTENTHYGPVRNPRDLRCSAGGSSGGSAAAVAAGVVPFTLGTDTNGSIRVPSSWCGVFGLKPTYGSISRNGMQLFSDSLDHVGVMARTAEDLGAVFGVVADSPLTGAPLPPRPRVGVLGGWFVDKAGPAARAAVARVAEAMSATRDVELPLAGAAHAAASVITYAEAGELHLDRIRNDRHRLDPVVRHRLVAGALLPADWYIRAQRVRARWVEQLTAAFEHYDLLLAPATPFVAQPIGTETVTIDGEDLPARPATGWLTQPLTPTGVPIGVAPITGLDGAGPLPLGVQVVAPAHHERWVLDALARLEDAGVASSPVTEIGGTES